MPKGGRVKTTTQRIFTREREPGARFTV